MYKKVLRYEDYDGNPQERAYFFNMTETELTKMQYSVEGNFQAYVQKLADNKDEAKMMDLIERLIVMSYGEKSDDGQRFVKVAPDGHKLGVDFLQTEAYNTLFMELMTNTNAVIDFVTGILPAKVRNQIPQDQIEEIKRTGAVEPTNLITQN